MSPEGAIQKKIHKSFLGYEQVAQTSSTPNPVGIASCPYFYANGLLRCSYDPLTEEKELQRDMRAPPGSGNLQRYSPTQGQH